MEDFNGKIPLFKKVDRAMFERIDKFKTTPGYTGLQDFYNGLEEDQQKLFKVVVIFFIFFLPALFLSFMWWTNNNLQAELQTRISVVSKANEIIGQRQGLRDVSPAILSPNPIDGESMMTSRISNLLSSMGVDLSKIRVSNFQGDMISTSIMRAESDFAFSNLSTDELMNIFTNMIQREKFRIQSVDIKRNDETNLLNGQFHAIHFSDAAQTGEEE